METRICTKCNASKPIDEYYTIITQRTGKEYTYRYCKKCHYSKMTKYTSKKWRIDNPDTWRALVNRTMHNYRGRQKAGVYCIFTLKGLYIGASKAITSRIGQHKTSPRGGNILNKGAKYLFHIILTEESDKDKRDAAERYWIKKLQPALNVELKK